jgi:hypothetical protein
MTEAHRLAMAGSVTQFTELSAALEREAGSAYLLSLDLRIICVNDGWRRFARENGAPELATSFDSSTPVTDVCDEPLRTFYRAGFARVQARGEPWSLLYECSSPSRYRKFSMRADMTPHRDGFVVVHSLVAEAPLERASLDTANFAAYSNLSGLIVQCSNCRRARRGSDGDTWDWLPQLVTTPPDNVSHGLCSSCDALYYWVLPPATG